MEGLGDNIQETGEFVLNLATMELAKQMNATAAHVARDVSEFEIAGLTAVPGRSSACPGSLKARCRSNAS